MKNRILTLLALGALGAFVIGCQQEATAFDDGHGPQVVSDEKAPITEVAVTASGDGEADEDYISPEDMAMAGLSGRWGRYMMGAMEGGEGNFNIEMGYACLSFLPNGTLDYEGISFALPYKAKGTYWVDRPNGKIHWTLTEITEHPEGTSKREFDYVLGEHTGKLGTHSLTGRQAIESENNPLFTYVQGVTWSKQKFCYVDEAGQRVSPVPEHSTSVPAGAYGPYKNRYGEHDSAYKEPKDPVHGVFPYETTEYRLEAVLDGKGNISHLRMTADYRFSDPDDPVGKADERGLILKGAKNWLKKHGLNYRIEVLN